MSVPPEVVELTRQWLTKAANDLKTAEHTLGLSDSECPFDTVCFHAQQCAEKSIKALLTFHGTDFRKTHDLGQLLLLLSARDPGLVHQLHRAKSLSAYAIETRYPGDSKPIKRPEAERAVRIARKVKEAIQKKLPTFPPSPEELKRKISHQKKLKRLISRLGKTPMRMTLRDLKRMRHRS